MVVSSTKNKMNKKIFGGVKLTVLVYTLCFIHDRAVSNFINTPDDVTCCNGTDVILNWTFVNEQNLSQAVWLKNGVKLLEKKNSDPASPVDGNTNVKHIKNGAINITAVSLLDGGQYTLTVSYIDLRPSLTGSVSISVLVPPSKPTYSISNDSVEHKVTCETSSRGTPDVDIQIKVGGVLKNSESAFVNYTQPIDCCLVGNASMCIIENTKNHDEYCENAITPSGPDNMKLSTSQHTYTLNEGETLGPITCSATCTPICTFIWTKDSTTKPIKENAVLSLKIRNEDDRGTYICTAKRGPYVTDTRNITVFVRYGPATAILQPPQTNYTVNSSTTLHGITCTSECFPICTQTWYKEGTTTSIVTVDGVLQLDRLKKEDAGAYICNATNSDLKKSAEARFALNIRYGPDRVILTPNNLTTNVVEGHILPDINCSSDCYPGCSESWWNVTGDNDFGKGRILSLKTVYRVFTGEYRCISTNIAPEYNKTDSASVKLIVSYFPDVHMGEIDDTVSELNDSLKVVCIVKAEPPVAFHKFIHVAPDGKTKVHEYYGNEQNDRIILTLHNITYMDSGSYSCNVSNGIRDYTTGKLNATDVIDVVIKGKPFIDDAEKIVDAAVGSDVLLNVSFFSNDGSSSEVRWFRLANNSRLEIASEDEQKYNFVTFMDYVDVPYHNVKISQQGHTTQLEIKNIHESDLVDYVVEIINSIGVSNHSITLSPRGAPEEPYNITILRGSETTSSVTLTWYSGFHGGADQTFHILFKTDISPWKEWTSIFGGKKTHRQFNVTVSDLHQNTLYSFVVYSKNDYGWRNSSVNVYAKTNQIPAPETKNSLTAVAVGGGVGGVLVITCVIVGVFVIRRRINRLPKKDDVRKLNDTKSRDKEKTETDFEVNLNPMYESAGEVPSVSNNNISTKVKKPLKNDDATFTADSNPYTDVKKPKKQEDPKYTTAAKGQDLYSTPVKKGKDTTAAKGQDLYSTPVKKGKGKQKKMKKQEKKKSAPTMKQRDDTVYENAECRNHDNKHQENFYENPANTSLDEKPSRTRNDQGLIYIDVDLPKTALQRNQKPVIHGEEDRTIYAEVAFGAVGEQLPESDEDEKTKDLESRDQ